MNKNIKYIIERNIDFNPVDYSDEVQDLIDMGTISNIPKVTHMYRMFDGCNKSIIPDWYR